MNAVQSYDFGIIRNDRSEYLTFTFDLRDLILVTSLEESTSIKTLHFTEHLKNTELNMESIRRLISQWTEFNQ